MNNGPSACGKPRPRPPLRSAAVRDGPRAGPTAFAAPSQAGAVETRSGRGLRLRRLSLHRPTSQIGRCPLCAPLAPFEPYFPLDAGKGMLQALWAASPLYLRIFLKRSETVPIALVPNPSAMGI
jgi:hypothetical protein